MTYRVISRLLGMMLATLALLAEPAAAQADGDRFGVMTYNIRLDLASDGADAWPNRRAMVAALIGYHAPDLIGLQEVLQHQKQALEADLPAYAFIGAARDDGRQAGEYSPIGYRRDRYRLLASGTFWLSPTPAVPGKGWDAAYPRIATWARLVERRGGRRLLMVNTHLDHVGLTARLEGARQLRGWIGAQRAKGEAVVLTGDFNSMADSDAYRTIVAPGPGALADTLRLTRTPHYGPAGTFTGFKVTQAQAGAIDHIFVSDGVTVLRQATLTDQTAGRLPSDHYPVLADLCVGRGC
jgi:endonuclease/exonuclease/phosphatase family metal-dependent hydrolase